MDRPRAADVRGDRTVRARRRRPGGRQGPPHRAANRWSAATCARWWPRSRPFPGSATSALTTNGILLAEQAPALWDAGLRRLNVSLDALNPAKFKQITRRDGYEKVIDGIRVAQQIGFDPVKVNAVSVRGLTEDGNRPARALRPETGVELRFIEYMPLDADCAWQREKVLFAHEILETLSREIAPWCRADDRIPGVPGDGVRLRRRRRSRRFHRLGEPAVLHGLQPVPPDGRRSSSVTACSAWKRPTFVIIRRGGGTTRRSTGRGPPIDRRQERRARDQHGPIHSGRRTTDVLHRRLRIADGGVSRWILRTLAIAAAWQENRQPRTVECQLSPDRADAHARLGRVHEQPRFTAQRIYLDNAATSFPKPPA